MASRILYRNILSKAQQFDKFPALKPFFRMPVLGLGTSTYSPATPHSFASAVRHAARSPDNIDKTQAFAILRSFNEIHDKYFKALYDSQPELLSLPSSSETTNDSKGLLSWFSKSSEREVFEVTPIAVHNNRLDSSSSTPKEAQQSHPFLTTGTVLLNHPLNMSPFPRCAILIVHSSPGHVIGLVLNFPTAATIGNRNYFFPAAFRDQPCHFGGSRMLIQDMPPVPNYIILHPYPSIPGSQVIVQGEGGSRPVCLSTGEDISVITSLVNSGVPVTDFKVFSGTFSLSMFEVEQMVRDGQWIPIKASSGYIRAGPMMGTLLWDSLLERCGGEYGHMRRVADVVAKMTLANTNPNADPPEEGPAQA